MQKYSNIEKSGKIQLPTQTQTQTCTHHTGIKDEEKIKSSHEMIGTRTL